MVAEEPAERMDHDDIEGRGLRGSRFDHALELGATVIGCRCAGFDEGLDQLQAARLAIGRSEEHTSELQSLMRISYAVFCLKKNKKSKKPNKDEKPEERNQTAGNKQQKTQVNHTN